MTGSIGTLGPDEFDRLIRARLADVYRPDGIEIWMTAPHTEWLSLTVPEMFHAGRHQDVLDRVNQLTAGTMD